MTDVELLDVLAEYQHKLVQLKAFLQVSHTVYLAAQSLVTKACTDDNAYRIMSKYR